MDDLDGANLNAMFERQTGLTVSEENQALLRDIIISLGTLFSTVLLNKVIGRAILNIFLVTKNPKDLRTTDRCYEV